MADAFLDTDRCDPPKRPVAERILDHREVELDLPADALRDQASRCMDCGVPFCHQGCPLGNLVPGGDDLVARDLWRDAVERLHRTNNFPEFTGKTCPAPCERACVLDLHGAPVTIKHVEKRIADRGWREGWIVPQPPTQRTGRSVAVVGSGPAGLAAAQQLRRLGHEVTVFERDDRLGGLLRYGIPDFKLDKADIDRRLRQLSAEGVRFRTGVAVHDAAALLADHHAVCLAVGAQAPRRLEVPGAALDGVVDALPYLVQQNRVVAGDAPDQRIEAAGRHVVVLGGGDTGADCVGTAIRQGAASVRQFHYKPAPPSERPAETPWPLWPMTLQTSTSHEEGASRGWSLVATAFEGRDGRLERIRCARADWRDGALQLGDEVVVEADLVLVAVGFVGVDGPLGVRVVGGRVGGDTYRTDVPGIFACGDARRGASLVVWAIREGREAARAVDAFLFGSR
ncbi:MAG: glutamate synthase subunit beta [Myxococcota bacterium]